MLNRRLSLSCGGFRRSDSLLRFLLLPSQKLPLLLKLDVLLIKSCHFFKNSLSFLIQSLILLLAFLVLLIELLDSVLVPFVLLEFGIKLLLHLADSLFCDGNVITAFINVNLVQSRLLHGKFVLILDVCKCLILLVLQTVFLFLDMLNPTAFFN